MRVDVLEQVRYHHWARRETDREISFWMTILLALLTLGIYALVVYWRLIARRDRHMERQLRLMLALRQAIRDDAAAANRDLSAELAEMDGLLAEAESDERPRNPWLWLGLSLLPYVGLFTSLYSYHFLNRDMAEHERREARLVALTASALYKLGRLPSPMGWEPGFPRRNFWLYLVLSVVTLGIFGAYWFYTVVTDPNRHFRMQAEWENDLMRAVGILPEGAA
jgi:hypothetical protein